MLTRSSVERELCRTSALIYEYTGKRPRYYRPPGGNMNATVVAAAESLGMSGAYWTLDGVRYEEAATGDALIKYVVGSARPGAIILLHNAPATTVASIRAIVRGLRARGFQLVTLSELERSAQPPARLAKQASRAGETVSGVRPQPVPYHSPPVFRHQSARETART